MSAHVWGPSRLNHGERQCVHCGCTNREAWALGDKCPKAPMRLALVKAEPKQDKAERALAELHPSVLLDETLDRVLKDEGMFFEKHDDVNYEMLNAHGRRDLRARLRSIMRAAGVWEDVERAARVWSNRICDERNADPERGS